MSLVNWISRYVERRQQRQDGKNEALVEQFNEREKRRRRAVGAVAIGVSDDKHNRDR
tara:strand:- start:102 stop:272 length:171 start_codon:yes stop_codon:yes gene_type:complete